MPCISSWKRDGTLPTKDDPNSNIQEWYTVLSNFSNALTDELLSDILSGKDFYLAFHTTNCTNGIPGNEVSGNGYERILCTFTKRDARAWHNAAAINGPLATGEWSATYVSLWDDVAAGNYKAWAQLASQVTVPANERINIPAGALVFKFDD